MSFSKNLKSFLRNKKFSPKIKSFTLKSFPTSLYSGYFKYSEDLTMRFKNSRDDGFRKLLTNLERFYHIKTGIFRVELSLVFIVKKWTGTLKSTLFLVQSYFLSTQVSKIISEIWNYFKSFRQQSVRKENLESFWQISKVFNLKFF